MKAFVIKYEYSQEIEAVYANKDKAKFHLGNLSDFASLIQVKVENNEFELFNKKWNLEDQSIQWVDLG